MSSLRSQKELPDAVQHELRMGLDQLPPAHFQLLFRKFDNSQITEIDTTTLKQWFKTIRTLREQNNTQRMDSFSNNQSLCLWIGLP